MYSLKLPEDLVAFLRAGRQLDYDPADCEAGAVTLLPLDQLQVELFPVDCQSTPIAEDDPHSAERGCYLVPGVSLLASCEGYEPAGLLLWLPEEGRYGTCDESHGPLRAFPREVTWTAIVADPAEYINAQWGEWPPDEVLVSWPKYRYSKKQWYEPLPLAALNDPNLGGS
jgi:hypothetical protein